MIDRKPKRTVSAPAKGCRNPQARFCTAMASVKSETDMPMSRVKGCMKMPSDCLSPILKVSMREAPIRIGRVGRKTCSRGIVLCSPFGRVRIRKRAKIEYTDLFTQAIMKTLSSRNEDIAVSHGKFAHQADHEGADSRNRRQAVLSQRHQGDWRRYDCGRNRHQQAHAL